MPLSCATSSSCRDSRRPRRAIRPDVPKPSRDSDRSVPGRSTNLIRTFCPAHRWPASGRLLVMIDDLERLTDGSELEADLCVVGAGAAGIALAREFLDTS